MVRFAPPSDPGEAPPPPSGTTRAVDTRDLDWFFGKGQAVFARSTQGAQLERAEVLAFGSGGKRHVREPTTLRMSDAGQLERWAPTWRYVPIKRTSSEPSYEPDHEELERFARVSRRLSHLNAATTDTLARLYGPQGARWEETRPAPQSAPLGRAWVLVPDLAPAKRALVKAIAAVEATRAEALAAKKENRDPVPSPTKAGRMPRCLWDCLATEQLAWLATCEQERPAWVHACLDLAEQQARAALRAWAATETFTLD